jgi:hypothetical protein
MSASEFAKLKDDLLCKLPKVVKKKVKMGGRVDKDFGRKQEEIVNTK